MIHRKMFIRLGMLCLIGLFGIMVILPNQGFLAYAQPYGLNIYVAPSGVLADNSVHSNIFVQLQDTNGAPFRAPADTTVQLSSSLVKIGTVPATVVIPKGSTGVLTTFSTTYTPGSTIITAVASGYASGQAYVNTVGPLPSALAVYGLPPVLPADGGSYAAVVVQLQDSNGQPAKAPIGNAQVSLFSSNVTVGTVTPSVVIPAGSSSAVANIQTVSGVSGSTTITAVSTGYLSGVATFTTQTPSFQASQLQVYLGPVRVPADGHTYQQIAVEVTNASGVISDVVGNLAVTLSSSAPQIGTVASSITIPTTKCLVLTSFTTTYQAGTTTITAVASNYGSSQAALTTVGSTPSQLGVYGFPSSLPANQQSYNAFVVQLQDSNGNPAIDPAGPTLINLFSSNSLAGTLGSNTLTIPLGQTQVTGSFQTTLLASSTIITAQRSGYAVGQTQITTYQIDQSPLTLKINVNKSSVIAGQSANVTATVSYADGSPTLIASVQFSSSAGGSFSSVTNFDNGTYLSTFTPPGVSTATNFTITASASVSGYQTAVQSVQIIVTGLSVSLSASPTSPIVGRSSSLTAHVTYSDGSPVLGASIQFSSNYGGSFSSVIEQGNGYYSTIFSPPIVAGQTYTIVASVSSFGNTATGTIQISVPQTSLGLSVTTSQSVVNAGTPTNVTASVSYVDGAPATDASVQFSSDNGGSFSTVTALGDGSYLSTFTPPGVSTTTNFTIVASASIAGYPTALQAVEVTVTGLKVSLTANPSNPIVGGASNVTAYLTYADGSPISGASVQFSSINGGSFSNVADDGSGYYSVIFTPLVVANQVYNIFVTASSSGNSASASTRITTGGISVSVSAIPSAIYDENSSTISAYVTYSDQTPVLGANLQFSTNIAGTFYNVTDYGNGTYNSVFVPIHVAGTTDFSIFVTASIPGAQCNGTTHLTVSKTPIVYSEILQIHVQDGSGNPLSGAYISSITQPAGVTVLSGTTNTNGDLLFSGALIGAYTLQVGKSGYNSQNVTFDFTGNQITPEVVILTAQTGLSLMEIYLIVAVVAVILVANVVVIVVRRRRLKKA